jgi:hypothetical protein
LPPWRGFTDTITDGDAHANCDSDNYAEANANAAAAAHATSSPDAVSELQKLESKRKLARQLASSLLFVAGR